MKVRVVVDPALGDALRRSRDRADRIVQAGLSHIGAELVTAAKSAVSDGPYKDSLRSDQDGSTVLAGSTSPLASIIERGRKPGRRPPAQSIRKRAGGSIEAAARAADRIAERGTRGQWVIKKANQRIKSDGTIDRIARDVVAAIGDLNAG